MLTIPFPGRDYPDTYIMGDYADSTDLGPKAGIFLGQSGVVESFPLPGGLRRWVVKTNGLVDDPQPEQLASLVLSRTVHKVDISTCAMISSFRVSNFLASRMSKGRIALAGDAAHVVSPIGGQGMNLGWLDAYALLEALIAERDNGSFSAEPFLEYDSARCRAAKAARRRAELNMWLGRGSSFGRIQKWAVKLILSQRFQPFFAKQFTMRGLD